MARRLRLAASSLLGHSDRRYPATPHADEMASARCFSKRGISSSLRQSRRDGTWRNGLIQLSAEDWDSSDLLAEHEQMDVVRTLVGLDALEITHVPETLILVEDADRAEDVARGPSGIERHLDVIHLGHRNVVMPRRAGVFELRQTMGEQLRLGNLGQHARQFRLNELEAADRTIELYAAQRYCRASS